MVRPAKSQAISKDSATGRMRVEFGAFIFDSGTRELLEHGRRVHVSPKAFDVLQVLLERRPRVVGKQELLERVWAGAFVGDASLSVTMAEVRQALRDDPRDGKLIRTVHRVGYAFCGTAIDREEIRPPAGGYSASWLRWNDRTVQLAEGENIAGRDPRCHVWVDASGVSRRHARLVAAGDRVTIEDLGSRNGTFVGGRQIAAAVVLTDGDTIELGAAALTFHRWSDEQSPPTERIGRSKKGQ
jgi:DNA-binding winged helix-turn-helix (wHTH) protein